MYYFIIITIPTDNKNTGDGEIRLIYNKKVSIN